MNVSAEARWFWRDRLPASPREWIVPNVIVVGPFQAAGEVWAKWTSSSLSVPTGEDIDVRKTRWLRKFDTEGPAPREVALTPDEQPADGQLPAQGRNVELTQLAIGDAACWTFGFEAFATFATVLNSLHDVSKLLTNRNPPGLGDSYFAIYPAWLNGIN